MRWKEDPEYPRLDLSVVILSAGKDLEMVRRCIESVLKACDAFSPKCELILLDNASESEVGLAMAALFPGMTVMRFPEQVGFSTGNNAGFQLTTGRVIVQLNDDTELAIDALVELAHFLQAHPEVGAVGPRLETPSGSLQVGYYARKLPRLRDIATHLFGLNALFPRNAISRRYFLLDDEDRTRPVEQPAGAALTYRRTALFAIGLLDEDYTFGYDDVDVCRRLLDSGWDIYYVREARVAHLGAASLPKNGPRIAIHTLNGLLCYWKKHGSTVEYAIVRLMMITALSLRIPIELLLSPRSAGAIATAYLAGIAMTIRSFFGPYQPRRLAVCAPIEVGRNYAWEARRG